MSAVADCEAMHAIMKHDRAAWDAGTTPHGQQEIADGSFAPFGECLCCGTSLVFRGDAATRAGKRERDTEWLPPLIPECGDDADAVTAAMWWATHVEVI